MHQVSQTDEEAALGVLSEPKAVPAVELTLPPGLLSPVTNGRVWVPPPPRVTREGQVSRSNTWYDLQLACGRLIKRSFDVLVSTTLLIIVAPLFVVVAVAIKLTSPGPIFFVQGRRGKGGRLFPCLKFRTMVPDAERILDSDDRLRELYKKYDHKLPAEHDSRISSVGRWLRASSLDELPQLLNVFIGHMSLVGPRPRTPAEADKFGDPYRREVIHGLKPGLTGLWQICGRSHIKGKARLDLDLRYARMQSFSTDLVILARTPYALLEHFRNGAH
jgi:lipopolysaccharide/colanic/teichoic acid biosynthesis glycosyltransferase